MSRLTVAVPGPHPTRNGQLLMDDKTLSGLTAYARRWDGEVTLAVSGGDAASKNSLGANWRQIDELPFEVSVADTLADAIKASAPDLAMANLTSHVDELDDVIERCVLLAESDPWLAAKEAWQPTRGLRRVRAVVGAAKRTRTYHHYVARARGLQCNGVPAYEALSRYNPSSMLFYDSRLYPDDLAAASTRQPSRTPTRMAFSGRLDPTKGPEHALAVAHQLQDLGVEMVVFGDGPLRAQLEREAGPNVTFRGVVDYSAEWLPWVRDHVDLMVLPHVQSDPSCTYLEAVGSGVPVLGFANAALQSLVDRFGIGWTVPMRDAHGLAAKARELLTEPSSIAEARSKGLAMMGEHHADAEFDARVAHLQTLT